MSLQISWESGDEILSIRVAIPKGSTFILSFAHPLMGFFWHFGQGSLKGLASLEPLRFVNDEARTEPDNDDNNSFILNEEKSELVAQVEEGLKYHPPEPVEEGINGSYFLRDKNGKIIAVFKPNDEEGNSENNPKRLDSEEEDEFVKRGIGRGEGAIREVAAYKLDKGHYSGVPETVMTCLSHPSFPSVDGRECKTGSLQAFVDNDGPAWDIGPGKFPVREVHKIGILDLRIFNNDRHGGNMLMRENFDNGQIELIPIDHGLSLSSTLDHAWFEWLNWPQAKLPFDDETRAYIDSIQVEEDAEMLRKMGFKEEAIQTMQISTHLLKRGSAAGLTLFEIGSMACRAMLDRPSLLEDMVEKVQSLDGSLRWQALWKIMDSLIAARKAEEK